MDNVCGEVTRVAAEDRQFSTVIERSKLAPFGSDCDFRHLHAHLFRHHGCSLSATCRMVLKPQKGFLLITSCM